MDLWRFTDGPSIQQRIVFFLLGKVVFIGNNEVLSSKKVDFTNVKWSPKQRNGGIAMIGHETCRYVDLSMLPVNTG